ncbi:MAG TPA: GNAT family N-acetyltransferase [Polyangiaceae bacterium]|nr:GNAT family N-acetyltransferase [Polyangiaceae bacterium]
MDAAISIRRARASDYSQLIALFDDLDRLHVEAAPWLLQRPERDPRPPEWLEAELADSNTAIFVADVGKCIGLAVIHLRDAPAFPLFISQKRGVIDGLVVHAAWRRSGVGRRLYRACEDWARTHDAPWVELNVYEFNTDATEFYDALGFSTTTRKLRKPLGTS